MRADIQTADARRNAERVRQPPKSPEECIFAQTTACFSSDFERRITPCQFGGNPDCSNCGCIASAGLEAIGRHRLKGGIAGGTNLLCVAARGQSRCRLCARPSARVTSSTTSSSVASFCSFSNSFCSFLPKSVFAQSSSKTSCSRLTTIASLDDQADLTPGIELERAKALAADEDRFTVADHGANVQPQTRHLLHAQRRRPALADLADDANVDARLRPQIQKPEHLRVGQLRVIDGKRLLRALDEGGELLRARCRDSRRTHQWSARIPAACVSASIEAQRLLHGRLCRVTRPKLRHFMSVGGVIEAEHMKLFAVHDHAACA